MAISRKWSWKEFTLLLVKVDFCHLKCVLESFISRNGLWAVRKMNRHPTMWTKQLQKIDKNDPCRWRVFLQLYIIFISWSSQRLCPRFARVGHILTQARGLVAGSPPSRLWPTAPFLPLPNPAACRRQWLFHQQHDTWQRCTVSFNILWGVRGMWLSSVPISTLIRSGATRAKLWNMAMHLSRLTREWSYEMSIPE